MCGRWNLRPWLAAVVLSTFAGLPSASASHHDGPRCSRPDVEFDSLEARLRCLCDRWRLSVEYEIETEDAPPGRFDLTIELTERGRLLRDARGRPITFVIPLDRPTEVDDDELEYEGRFTINLRRRVFCDPKRLKVEALIVDRYTKRVVEHKRKSVKYKR